MDRGRRSGREGQECSLRSHGCEVSTGQAGGGSEARVTEDDTARRPRCGPSQEPGACPCFWLLRPLRKGLGHLLFSHAAKGQTDDAGPQ